MVVVVVVLIEVTLPNRARVRQDSHIVHVRRELRWTSGKTKIIRVKHQPRAECHSGRRLNICIQITRTDFCAGGCVKGL